MDDLRVDQSRDADDHVAVMIVDRNATPITAPLVSQPGFPISPWYRTHRINRRVLSLQGSDARSRTTEGDTWWVKKKTVRFSSHSTAC